jgi:molybdopterin biosynthesis enzyme
MPDYATQLNSLCSRGFVYVATGARVAELIDTIQAGEDVETFGHEVRAVFQPGRGMWKVELV